MLSKKAQCKLRKNELQCIQCLYNVPVSTKLEKHYHSAMMCFLVGESLEMVENPLPIPFTRTIEAR